MKRSTTFALLGAASVITAGPGAALLLQAVGRLRRTGHHRRR